MHSKTLIAIAVAGLLTAPLALAQYDRDKSVSSAAPGSASTSSNANVTGKANEDKGSPGTDRSAAGASDRTLPGGSASATTSTTISASEFRQMDKNHDGFLSKDEVQGNSSLSANFDSLDKNHDGKLAQAEVTGSASASSSPRERISRNDSSTGSTDQAPNVPRNPQTSGNPPKQGGSPEPQ
jgi:hypothetical protein